MKTLLCLVAASAVVSTCLRKAGADDTISYLPLGDSYTICEGAKTEESWPVILTGHLNENGLKVGLIANPARTGYTTQNLIDKELPLLEKSNVDFVTLCIGVNDWVRGADSAAFHKNLAYILDAVKSKISDPRRILLLTIPDFSAAPQGKLYSKGRDISKGLSQFNGLILYEAGKRGLKTVDLFGLSQEMRNDLTLVAADGLHPSAKEYAIWEKEIFPVALELLKD